MWYVVTCIVGMILGGVIVRLCTIRKRSGVIFVTQDEDGVYLSLRLNTMYDIVGKNEVTLGVVTQK